MPDGSALMPSMVYLFDGSFAGLLCCIYERYVRRERVEELWAQDEARMSLYPTRAVETDEAHACRVHASLEKKLGGEGKELVQMAFMSAEPDKNTVVFRFIELGYRYGPRAASMLTDPAAARIRKLHRGVWNEQHHYLGFVRFCECPLPGALCPRPGALALPGSKNALAAVIKPKHHILPLIAGHFCDRFPEETFIIYDCVRGLALVYRDHRAELVKMDGSALAGTVGTGSSAHEELIEMDGSALAGTVGTGSSALAEMEEDDALYQRLWKGYYDAIAIQSRINPHLRMNHMPKRFWDLLPEMDDSTG